jgi:hypothetical protein
MSLALMGVRYNVQFVYNGLFIFLFASTVLFVLVTFRKNYLKITPSDFLLITLPLMVLLVPDPYKTEFMLNIIGLRCLVFFIALRSMAKRRQQSLHKIRLAMMLSLTYIVLTSLLDFRIVY